MNEETLEVIGNIRNSTLSKSCNRDKNHILNWGGGRIYLLCSTIFEKGF